MSLHSNRQRLWTILSIIVIVPVGFYSKFYSGPAQHWVRDSLCGVFYVIFWCLVVFLFFYRMGPGLIAGIVLAATCGLEFLQLWHPPILQYLRSSFLGQTILGTTFSWSDFPYYFVGAGLGWLWLQALPRGRHFAVRKLRIDSHL